MLGIGFDTHPRSLSEKEFQREIEALGSRAELAARRAANRTATSARTWVSKRVRQDKALKARRVKETIDIERARRGSRPKARVTVKYEAIPLKAYGARTTRKGVTVRVKKSEGRKVVKGGFIVDSLGGHVFKRKDGAPRLPIEKLFGPSVRVEVERVEDELRQFVDKTFEKRLREQLNYEIMKAWGTA